jgi:hypothetical protein
MNRIAMSDIPTMPAAPEPVPVPVPADALAPSREFKNLFMEIDDSVGELTHDLFPLLYIQPI